MLKFICVSTLFICALSVPLEPSAPQGGAAVLQPAQNLPKSTNDGLQRPSPINPSIPSDPRPADRIVLVDPKENVQNPKVQHKREDVLPPSVHAYERQSNEKTKADPNKKDETASNKNPTDFHRRSDQVDNIHTDNAKKAANHSPKEGLVNKEDSKPNTESASRKVREAPKESNSDNAPKAPPSKSEQDSDSAKKQSNAHKRDTVTHNAQQTPGHATNTDGKQSDEKQTNKKDQHEKNTESKSIVNDHKVHRRETEHKSKEEKNVPKPESSPASDSQQSKNAAARPKTSKRETEKDSATNVSNSKTNQKYGLSSQENKTPTHAAPGVIASQHVAQEKRDV